MDEWARLLVDPGQAGLVEVPLQLSLLPAADFSPSPLPIDELGLDHLADVAFGF